MTLVHHSSKDYNQAASEAAANMRNKLEAMFDAGRGRAASALDQLQREQPTDYVVPAQSLRFIPEVVQGKREIITRLGEDGTIRTAFRNPPHALGQIGDVACVPRKYVQKRMETEWGTELVAHIFNETFKHTGTRHLVRTVDDQVRGFLSDRYRRMDGAPILESFIKTATALGAVPVESKVLPTKFFLKMMLPMVFEPVQNEVMAFGVKLQTSDYGDGALVLQAVLLRLWCTNFASCEDALRKIHLGSRLGQDLALSQKTYELDSKALASATEDVVCQTLGPDKVNEKLAIIKKASEDNIKVKDVVEALRKRSKVTKAEEEIIVEKFNTPDVEMLPPGNTMWRLSNAISLFAQSTDAGRALELEQLAGEVAGLVEK